MKHMMEDMSHMCLKAGVHALKIKVMKHFFFDNWGVRVSLRVRQLIPGLTEHPANPVNM